ncbi:MAG: 2-hydroxychromene-2-carboxylate isomerase [Cellvibrionales bacterium]|nr:2-hydroxychromene-2-carboxylate isomerase [Cellvibrionales bacterium]HCH20695.1 2-hydroxychromene-2-carboxylate isomerase [Cellvibrionales bacterium]
MSKPSIECFFDCSSPWTYMGFERLLKLKQRYEFDIIWKPILVGGVFNEVNQGLYEARESMFNNERRLTAFMKDLQDWARYCELSINWPDFHPVNSVKAMRGCIVALEHGRLIDFARGCFQAYWNQLEDISKDDVLASIAVTANIDETLLLNSIQQTEIKNQLRANTDELIARGGYGSPTFFINRDDMYFGNDRIPLIEHALSYA